MNINQYNEMEIMKENGFQKQDILYKIMIRQNNTLISIGVCDTAIWTTNAIRAWLKSLGCTGVLRPFYADIELVSYFRTVWDNSGEQPISIRDKDYHYDFILNNRKTEKDFPEYKKFVSRELDNILNKMF